MPADEHCDLSPIVPKQGEAPIADGDYTASGAMAELRRERAASVRSLRSRRVFMFGIRTAVNFNTAALVEEDQKMSHLAVEPNCRIYEIFNVTRELRSRSES